MRFGQFALISSCCLALTWTAAKAQNTQPSVGDTGKSVPPAIEPLVTADTPVITAHGLCENHPSLLQVGQTSPQASAQSTKDKSDGATATADCNTVVTRSQFENLINALNPNARPEKRRKFAEDYPETALYAQQGHLLGLEKTPEFQELVRFRTLEALSQIYKHYMQEKAAEIPDANVQKFYQENPQRFEQFALKRVFVPKTKLHDPAHPASDPAADAAAMKAVADKIRAEAAAGTDFDALQDEAYKSAGDNESALETDLGDKWTRDNLPAGYLKVVLTLQPGQTAQPVLFGDGWYVFKLISKRMIPIGEARTQMQALAINDMVKALKNSIKTELNTAYFGMPGSNPSIPQPSQ